MALIARKNIDDLTPGEWDRFLTALQLFKNPNYPNPLPAGTVSPYDAITRHHATAQATLTLMRDKTTGVLETGTSRNVAHRGPAFFPWHRQALRELELALIALQPAPPAGEDYVGIPYWRWNFDVANWRNHAIWTKIGGNGDSTQGYRITTGPFVNWVSWIRNSNGVFNSRAGIVRRFTATGNMPSWGNTNITTYDVAPFRENSSTATSFRSFMETKHNSVHTRVGGDMTAMTSPNDPVFWFHHCNVDRAWARWQQRRDLPTATTPRSNLQPKDAVYDAAGIAITPGTPLPPFIAGTNPPQPIYIYKADGTPLPHGHHFNSVLNELGSTAAQKTNGVMLDWENFDLDAEGNISGYYYVNTGLPNGPGTTINP
jgi:tyrosinase